MKKEYLILLGVIFLYSCSASKKMQSKPNVQDVFFVQKGKKKLVKANDQLTVAKAPFSLQFHGKRYAENEYNPIRIAALSNQSVYDKVAVGQEKNALANFGPATGLAGAKQGYSALFINDYGHHYLYYENEQHRRLKLLNDYGDHLFFEFPISKFFIDEMFYDIEKAPISTLYLVIFIDRNSDEIMDAGELTKLVLQLE